MGRKGVPPSKVRKRKTPNPRKRKRKLPLVESPDVVHRDSEFGKPTKKEKKEDGSSATPIRRSSRVILPKYPSPQVGNASSVVESTSSHVGSTSSHFGSTSSHVGSHVEEQDTDSMEESFQESTEEESVLERLCRLCLQELEDFTYIFEFDDIHRFNVGDVIIDLMGMDLNPDDGYPSKICNDCLEELARFRRFKGKCFESRSRLKEMIQAPTYSDVDFEHAAFPSVAGERAAGEEPLQSETAEEPRIKQETNLLMSYHQSESGNDSSQKQDLQRVDKVMVKEEIMSCEPPSVEKMTFHEELIIPSEPTSADTVIVNEGLMMPYEPTSVDKVTVNQELMMPCQPTSVDKVTVSQELMMPCQPMSVDKVTVNLELMMPCQPMSVDKVTVNELVMPCQPTSVDKVTVKEEFMSPEPTGVTNVWSDSGEGTARESITKLQDEHNPLEEPNVPCPLVAAEGLSVSVKEEVFSEDEELGENVGGLGGKGRMAR